MSISSFAIKSNLLWRNAWARGLPAWRYLKRLMFNSLAERDSTDHNDTETAGVPAYMKARVKPRTPSPLIFSPRPGLQADKCRVGNVVAHLKLQLNGGIEAIILPHIIPLTPIIPN